VPVLAFDITLPAPLSEVWQFHEDVRGALPALSPPDARLVIESADLPVHVGSRIIVTARDPLGRRLRWVAKYVEHQPPTSAAPRAARFVDEQESGPFAAWRHEHLFDEVAPGVTRLTDRITYRVPLGPLGVVADWLFVRRQIVTMFRHRHEVLARTFANQLAPPPAAAVHSAA
jgi:ligand-binding SRPBCC domain-containing protein